MTKKSVPPKGKSPSIPNGAKMPSGVKYTAGEKGRNPPYGCDKTKKKKYS